MKRKLHNYRQKSIFTVVLISLLFLVNPDTVWAFQDQEQITSFTQYKGEVLDEDTKRPLVFATLTLEGSNVSTVSNTEGEFALKIPTSISEGNVRVSFLGYKTRILPLAQFTTENNQINQSRSTNWREPSCGVRAGQGPLCAEKARQALFALLAPDMQVDCPSAFG